MALARGNLVISDAVNGNLRDPTDAIPLSAINQIAPPCSVFSGAQYPCGNVVGDPDANTAFAIDTLFAIPLIASPLFTTVVRLGFMVQAAGAVGSIARVGLYRNTVPASLNHIPGAKIVDGGQFTTVANNQQRKATVSVSLRPGEILWAVYLCGVAAPTIYAWTPARYIPALGYGPNTPQTSQPVWSIAFPYAALPETFPGGGGWTVSNIPGIWVSYA